MQTSPMAVLYVDPWRRTIALLLLGLLTAGAQGRRGSSQDIGHPRLLTTAAQGATGAAGEDMLPVGVHEQPLCSATIYYGASVGDASKKTVDEVVPFVGSFDVVVTQPQLLGQVAPGDSGDRWRLGWQFEAGEQVQQSKDVFGDDGIQKVFMSPNLQDANDTDAAARLRDTNNRQHVAVFSNTSLDGSNSEVIVSFVARKGPAQPANPSAPFRVAPPTHVFLNNHECQPLSKTQSSRVDSVVQEKVEVATPGLSPADMPKRLQVEYLPVEREAVKDDAALYAKKPTQFYFKITNTGAAPVYLDQVVLQYWFHGPLGGTTDAASSSIGGTTAAAGVSDKVEQMWASQFRLTCSDASPELGCGGLAWNVTPGLPTAFGARYVLNIWFPTVSSNSSSTDIPKRYVLGTASTNSTTNNLNGQRVQALADVQAIVAIEPRRFFANISGANDYSYLGTPVLPAQQGGNSSDDGRLVRHKQEANPRMPAYIAQELAWGSPPVGGMASRPGSTLTAGNNSRPLVGGKAALPPGSYCQSSPGGGLVCGVDVVYCCAGSGPLNVSGVPPNWQQRLANTTA